MGRIAVYECPCCARRLSQPMPARRRAAPSIQCEGWCLRCGGACHDSARCIAVEPDEDPATLVQALIADAARLVKPSRRLDLPDFRPQDLAW